MMPPASETSLPAAREVEQALLGSILFDNAVLKRLDESLTPDAFAEPFHGRLWEVVTGLIDRGRLAEPTVLVERFRADPAFEEFGGLKYLADLVDHAPPSANAPEYARHLGDLARRREIIRVASETAAAARDADQDAFEVISRTGTAMTALMAAAAPDGAHLVDAPTSMAQTIATMREEARTGRGRGALTGLRCYDRRLGGLQPGKLIVVAGRPSMGKSGLARAGAVGCARKNPDAEVLFFTVEMLREEIDHRSLAQLSYEDGRGIKYQDMAAPDPLPPETLDRLEHLSRRMPSNLLMDDTPVLSVEYVRRRVLSRQRTGRPLVAVFIDYLQIMARPVSRNGQNDAALIQVMTSALKQLAREARCCIVLLSQLSRQVEQRENKRPMLSDLRESGAIEQDADAVLFCFREHYYLTREGPTRGTTDADHALKLAEVETRMEVICAKQRRGSVGTDVQRYLAPYDVVEDEGTWL